MPLDPGLLRELQKRGLSAPDQQPKASLPPGLREEMEKRGLAPPADDASSSKQGGLAGAWQKLIADLDISLEWWRPKCPAHHSHRALDKSVRACRNLSADFCCVGKLSLVNGTHDVSPPRKLLDTEMIDLNWEGRVRSHGVAGSLRPFCPCHTVPLAVGPAKKAALRDPISKRWAVPLSTTTPKLDSPGAQASVTEGSLSPEGRAAEEPPGETERVVTATTDAGAKTINVAAVTFASDWGSTDATGMIEVSHAAQNQQPERSTVARLMRQASQTERVCR